MNEKTPSIITNCPLCEERGLHIMKTADEKDVRQCINCGYVTAENLLLNGKDVSMNQTYAHLTEDMKAWSKVHDDRIWMPVVITLPFAMLYPDNVKNKKTDELEMKWRIAYMVDIPEKDQKNYPVENVEDQFYNKRYDTENAKSYSLFVYAMTELNEYSKKFDSKNER